ncbi:MAG: hypothetical protein Q7S95_00235 [bacterium]|nr:hypothetical protein [bacterium]
MPDQPLQPFALPQGISLHLSAGSAIGSALLLVLIFWTVYTAVAVYHWVKYSHAAPVASLAITVHLAVSGVLLLFILLGAILP